MVLKDFPATHGNEREEKIIECVHTGRARYKFVNITSEYNGHTAEFQVFEDALKVDGVRVNVNAETQQKIADLLNCVLPTAKLYDIMWHSAKNRIVPHPQQITPTTEAMIDHSKRIDKDIKEINGLKSSVGKIWIIDNSLASKPEKACNYGWHFEDGTSFKGIKGNINVSKLKNPKTGLYWHMIQSRGWHHSPTHVDYSQICILVSRQCWVDGNEMDILDVFKDPELAPLAVHDGVLKVIRQPNVQELNPIVDLPVKQSKLIPIPEIIPISYEPEPEIIPISYEPEPVIINPENTEPITKDNGGIWALIISIISLLFGKRGE